MARTLNRAELIMRVERLMSGRWNIEEMEQLFQEISSSVPCPFAEIQGYIFHASDDPNAETIVERMLAYKPIILKK